MTYERALWLPKVLKAVGIEVVEHDGWKTRGLGEYRPFQVLAVVWHHDASAIGDSPGVPDYMIRNFETAGAQIWVDRAGRWHLIASGRAAHAGSVRPGMPTNETSLGVETDHTTGEGWPPALLESLRVGTAAILKHVGKDEQGLHFHKTICDPPGRKVDPAGLDLAPERARVADVIRDLTPVPADTRPTVSLKRLRRASRRARWARGFSPRTRRDVRVVRAALAAEEAQSFAEWQRRLGLVGDDADGIPGLVSLRRLGRRHGFKVGA